MTELMCVGTGTYDVCVPIEGVVVDTKGLKVPEYYKGWNIEKAVYSPADDKIYVQLSYNGLRRVITL